MPSVSRMAAISLRENVPTSPFLRRSAGRSMISAAAGSGVCCSVHVPGHGGAEHDPGAVNARQGDGGIAAVVAGSRLRLLVGRVLFFVHDDQPQGAERQEERGPRTEDDGRDAAAQGFRDGAPADRCPAGMEEVQPGTEFRGQDGLQPVAEGDFRGQYQDLAALGERLPDGRKIRLPPLRGGPDLGLAGVGNARGRMTGLRAPGGGDPCAQRVAFRFQPLPDPFAVPAGELFFLAGELLFQTDDDPGGRLLTALPEERIRRFVNFSRCAEVVAGQEFPETELFRRDVRQPLLNGNNVLDAFRRQVRPIQRAPDHPVVAFAAERHAHAPARLQRNGGAVGGHPPELDRQEHLDVCPVCRHVPQRDQSVSVSGSLAVRANSIRAGEMWQ